MNERIGMPAPDKKPCQFCGRDITLTEKGLAKHRGMCYRMEMYCNRIEEEQKKKREANIFMRFIAAAMGGGHI